MISPTFRYKTHTLAAAVVLSIVTMAASSAAASPVGPVKSVSPLTAANPTWDIRTEDGTLIQVQVLADDLIRVQAGRNGKLTDSGDKAAKIVLPQAPSSPSATLQEQGQQITVRTPKLILRIDRAPLTMHLARIEDGQEIKLWSELQPLNLDKEQTVQALSSDANEQFFGGGQQNGRFAFKGVELPISYSGGWEDGDRPSPAPMLLSSKGWGMLRNTWSNGNYDLRMADASTLSHQEDRFDAYYFVGADLPALLDRYTALTGRSGLLPRWGYSYGDADCYNDGDNKKKPGTFPAEWSDGPTGTTPDVVAAVAAKYREMDMPGGWILPNDGYGCGYANLPETVQGLAKYGFKTGLWTENGVDKIAWEVGTAGSRVQKLDVAWTGKGYQFALDANKSAYDGLYSNSDSRPFIWSVMGWAGIQRYAVAWTGDQSGSWDYIRWHIPTLIGSGLSGYAYATGDVDGIFGGSPETYTRDLQWKAFTPVLMGMSGWSANTRKHPWAFAEPYLSINRDYLKLKMRLTPYMYGLARDAELKGAPPVRGLMWDHPEDPHANDEAYKYQYFLGRDLLVAPVYRSQAASRGWRRDIYLPAGRWTDYWDGRSVDVGADGLRIDRAVDLKTLPIFVRAGAILPMYPEMLYDGEKPVNEVTFDLYPQGDSHYTLYEDDGNTRKYQAGSFSEQKVQVTAPATGTGNVHVAIGPVQGQYDGQLAQRSYALRVLSQTAPTSVTVGGSALAALASKAAFDAGKEGWFFDPVDRKGTVWVRSGATDIRKPVNIELTVPATAVAVNHGFPDAPALGREVPADALVVVNRPAEEPGHPLENAFDDDPATWFRSVRNQAIKTGAHEWTVGFGERKSVDGIEVAPRNDKNWKYGQIRDYEIYMADTNGEWGQPIATGRLKLMQDQQRIDFAPHAGRLLRFRVLSTQNPDGDGASANDPMVLASKDAPSIAAVDSQQPAAVQPVTLSTFHVLEHKPADKPRQQKYLSTLTIPAALAGTVSADKAHGGKTALRMNGLAFRSGLGVAAKSAIDLQLSGNWNLLRADIGIDDICRTQGAMQFQVWGDGRLVYSSGTVKAPGVVKPELDVRGIKRLSLRTLGVDSNKVCGNWVNAALIGQEGDTVTVIKP